jgi:hypothetical protein
LGREAKGGWEVRAESLEEVIRAVPFRPFSLMLADGTRLAVSHPEWIMLPPGTRTAVHMTPDERVRILDVGLVLGVDVEPPVPAGTPAPSPDGGE